MIRRVLATALTLALMGCDPEAAKPDGGSGGGGGVTGGGGGSTGGGGGSQTDAGVGDIVAVASGNPQFSILVQAVTKAGLVSALQAPGGKTVFAPTNAAFAALLTELGVSSLDGLSAEQHCTEQRLLGLEVVGKEPNRARA